jgi:hypothetical protein
MNPGAEPPPQAIEFEPLVLPERSDGKGLRLSPWILPPRSGVRTARLSGAVFATLSSRMVRSFVLLHVALDDHLTK